MAIAALQQTVTVTVPAWVGPTMAISLAIVAASFVVLAIVLGTAALRVARQAQALADLATGFQDDIARTVASVRGLTEQAQDVMALVRSEAGAFADTSRRLRRRIVKGADRLQAKLMDLEALYEVVHEEVEDTALDLAAGLRSIRHGDGMISRVRRMLVPGR
jgi:hypothetical protein